jgi:hypothetical protein
MRFPETEGREIFQNHCHLLSGYGHLVGRGPQIDIATEKITTANAVIWHASAAFDA